MQLWRKNKYAKVKNIKKSGNAKTLKLIEMPYKPFKICVIHWFLSLQGLTL